MATKAMRWQLTKTARQGFWMGGGFAVAGLLAFVGVLAGTGVAWLALLGAYLLATGIAYLASAVALHRRQRRAGCDGKPEGSVPTVPPSSW
jgi:uncharacterized membrane protein HdeD (DUF308 family)